MTDLLQVGILTLGPTGASLQYKVILTTIGLVAVIVTAIIGTRMKRRK